MQERCKRTKWGRAREEHQRQQQTAAATQQNPSTTNKMHKQMAMAENGKIIPKQMTELTSIDVFCAQKKKQSSSSSNSTTSHMPRFVLISIEQQNPVYPVFLSFSRSFVVCQWALYIDSNTQTQRHTETHRNTRAFCCQFHGGFLLSVTIRRSAIAFHSALILLFGFCQLEDGDNSRCMLGMYIFHMRLLCVYIKLILISFLPLCALKPKKINSGKTTIGSTQNHRRRQTTTATTKTQI